MGPAVGPSLPCLVPFAQALIGPYWSYTALLDRMGPISGLEASNGRRQTKGIGQKASSEAVESALRRQTGGVERKA